MTDKTVKAIDKAKKIYTEKYEIVSDIKELFLLDIKDNNTNDKWLITLMPIEDFDNNNYDRMKIIEIEKK